MMSVGALRKFMSGTVAIAVTMAVTAVPSNAAVPVAAATSKICLPVHLTATGGADPDPDADPALINTVSEVFLGPFQVAKTTASFTAGGVVGDLLAFAGPIVFTPTSSSATLTANVQGELNVGTEKFKATSTSVTGTGPLTGISGSLTFRGTQDLADGSFTETITGALCSRVRPW